MSKILNDISRTFSEYLLLPGLTEKKHTPSQTNLSTPIAAVSSKEKPRFSLNIPVVSAAMQAVTGSEMAIALARRGGIGFLFCSQTIESQAGMVNKVKSHKAGFVKSDTNIKPTDTLKELLRKMKESGHSTVPVTENGESNGKLVGLITDKDFWEFEDNLEDIVSRYMTPLEKVVYGNIGINLKEANATLHRHKKECLPILEQDGKLNSLVFKKDYIDHQNYPLELLDSKKRLVVGVAINTHDYKERVPALMKAEADVLCFDSSDGYTEYQKEAVLWVREHYPNAIIGGGNIVSSEAFRYLVEEAHVDFVKVGIGGGSICITREQKGIGRGQASALLDVVSERNKYYKESGRYIPICSDGGLANDTQIIVALAMGADFVMMGRYFSMTHESPTPTVSIKGRPYKPYWGEGSNRARNWQRYGSESYGSKGLLFEEGVDGYVPIVGSVSDILGITLAKLRSTMCNIGASTLSEFSQKSVLTLISEASIKEGGTSNIVQFDSAINEESN